MKTWASTERTNKGEWMVVIHYGPTVKTLYSGNAIYKDKKEADEWVRVINLQYGYKG